MAWKQSFAAATALAALFGLAAIPASAAPITLNLSFSGTSFADELASSVPPSSSVAGSFAVTLDPTLQYTDATSGLTVRSLTGVTVSSPLAFSYFPSDHSFYLGGSQNGADAIASGTNDFQLVLNLTSIYGPTLVTCADPANDCGFANGNANVLATAYTSTAFPNSGFFLSASGARVTVPEPGSLAIVLAGIGGLAMAGLGRSLSPGNVTRDRITV